MRIVQRQEDVDSVANLHEALVSKEKTQFFDYLSSEAYSNLPTDVLSMFEGANDGDRRPYIIFDPLVVSSDFCKAIREAAETFWSLATSTGKVFRHLSESEILDWGYSGDYIPQILAIDLPPTEMRIDVAVNPDAYWANEFRLEDFKVLEANSATPGFWAETFVLNQLIAEKFGGECPNKKMGASHAGDFILYLRTNFPEYVHGQDTVYFSFLYSGEHEDILSFDARMGHFEQLGGKAKFMYVEDMALETDDAKETGLFDREGNPVKYLFLHYPNEWLIEEHGEVFTDESLNTIPAARPWDYLQEMVLGGRLFRVPPISSEIIQNKAFFAFLWSGVHLKRFDLETEKEIKALIPQTYCTIEEAREQELDLIWEKPIYGREGAGIILWDSNLEEVTSTYDLEFDDDDWYQNMLAIFQENCPMPTKAYDDKELTLMFTVYLSDLGQATGIGCRAIAKPSLAIDAKEGLWQPLMIKK